MSQLQDQKDSTLRLLRESLLRNTNLIPERTWEKRETYIYFILLLKLGWMVSGYHLKIYMTRAQLSEEKTGHADFWIVSLCEAERKGWDNDGVVEVNDEDVRVRRGCIDSLARASITRAKT
jgi:hypothetical protein